MSILIYHVGKEWPAMPCHFLIALNERLMDGLIQDHANLPPPFAGTSINSLHPFI